MAKQKTKETVILIRLPDANARQGDTTLTIQHAIWAYGTILLQRIESVQQDQCVSFTVIDTWNSSKFHRFLPKIGARMV